MLANVAAFLSASATWITDQTGTRLAIPVLGALVGFTSAALQLYFSHRRRRIETEPDFRKLEAKRWNEHIKLYGSFSNTLGIAIVGAAFIVPYAKDHNWPQGEAVWWMLLGAALPASGQFVIRFIQSESRAMPDTNLLLLLVGIVIGGAVGFFAIGSRAFRPPSSKHGTAVKPVAARH